MKVKIKTWKELLGTNGVILYEGSKETVIRMKGYCSFTSIMESSLPKDRIIEIDSNSICLLLHSQYFIEDWMVAEYIKDDDICEQKTDQYKGKEMENNTTEINTSHTPIKELQQIILNGKTYNLVPVDDAKHVEPIIEKWEPKGGEWIVYTDGVRSHSNSTPEYASFGIEYATKEQAEKAYKEIRKHNRLLAWLAENDDGWEADWTNSDSKYYVAYAHERGKYEVYDNYTTEISSAVYMSEINAYKLVDLLNKGIVEL